MFGYLLRPCKTTAAFEAIPDTSGRTYKLDLTNCTKLLVAVGYRLVCDTKVMVIVEKDVEVSIYPSGKMILKTDSKSDAETVMDEIYHTIFV